MVLKQHFQQSFSYIIEIKHILCTGTYTLYNRPVPRLFWRGVRILFGEGFGASTRIKDYATKLTYMTYDYILFPLDFSPFLTIGFVST
jgi:hypothetical protein